MMAMRSGPGLKHEIELQSDRVLTNRLGAVGDAAGNPRITAIPPNHNGAVFVQFYARAHADAAGSDVTASDVTRRAVDEHFHLLVPLESFVGPLGIVSIGLSDESGFVDPLGYD
jgi:hypothetical protein